VTTLLLPLPSTYNDAKAKTPTPEVTQLDTGCGNPKDKNIQVIVSKYF
jgi:hypothetical protein